jgi:hypothetical protein
MKVIGERVEHSSIMVEIFLLFFCAGSGNNQGDIGNAIEMILEKTGGGVGSRHMRY